MIDIRTTIRRTALLAVILLMAGQLINGSEIAHADNVTISGYINDPDGETSGTDGKWNCDEANLNIKVEVNGLAEYSTTCTDSLGTYSIGGVSLYANDVVVVFVDDASHKSAFISKVQTPGNIIADFENFYGAVRVGDDDDGGTWTISNADFGLYATGNVPYTVVGGTFTPEGELYLSAAKTWSPNGAISIANTLVVASGAILNFDTTGNTVGYLYSSGSVQMAADTAIGTINALAGSAISYSGTPTVTISGNITNNASSLSLYDLTYTGSGTKLIIGSGTLAITNNLSIPNGVTWSTQQNVTVGGSLTTTGTGAISYSGTPTVQVSGSVLGGGSGNQLYYNLVKAGSGTTTWTGSGINEIKNGLTVLAGEFIAGTSLYTPTVTESGGTFSNTSGTITLTGTTDATFSASGGVNNLTLPDYNGTIGYWKLDETSGTAATDSSRYHMNGSYVGSLTPSTSDTASLSFSNAASLEFPGTNNNYVSITDPSSLNTNLGSQMTIAAWIKPVDFTQYQSVLYAQKSSTFAWNLWYYNDVMTFRVGTTVVSSAAGDLTAGTWQFIAGVYGETSNSMRLYVNGHEYTGSSSSVLTSIASLRIGGSAAGDECMKGKIDDVRIYNRALSSAEIATLKTGSELAVTRPVYTLGSDLTVNGTLNINSTTLNVNGHQLTVEEPFVMSNDAGIYNGSTNTQTFNSGVTVSAGTFTGSSGTTVIDGSFTQTGGTVTTGAGTWDVSGSMTPAASGFTISDGNTLTMTGTGTLTLGSHTLQNFSVNTSGTVTLADASYTVAGDMIFASGGTLSAGTAAFTMTGADVEIAGGGKILYDLTISGTAALLTTSDLTVSHTLTIDSGKTLTLGSGRTLTLSRSSGTALTISGTLTGTGLLVYQSTDTFPTGGTLTAPIRLDLVNVAADGSTVLPQRAYDGVEIYHSTSGNKTVNANSSTAYSFSGTTDDFVLTAAGSGNLTFDFTASSTYNPAVTIDGNFTLDKTSTGTPAVITGTAAWSVGGNIDLAGGAFTTGTGHVLTMTGTSSTLQGGGLTLKNVTIDPATAGTITLTGSDVTVSGTVVVAVDDTLSLGSGRTLTSNGTLTLNGTISGDGTFVTTTGTIGTAGTFTTNLTLYLDGSDITLPTRTYAGSTHTVTFTMANGGSVLLGTTGDPLTIEGNLVLNDPDGNSISVDASVHNPPVIIGGNFSTTSGSWGILLMGSNTWTVGGNFDLTYVYEFSHSNGTLALSGDTSILTSNGAMLYNLTTSGDNVTTVDALTVTHDLTVTAGSLTVAQSTVTVGGSFINQGTYRQPAGTLLMNAGSTGKIFEAGTATIDDLAFNNAAGGWTVQTNDVTAGGNLSLTAAASFTVASGRTVTVGGTFRNAVGGTWTGSMLYLNGTNAEDAVNTKTAGAAVYGTVRVGQNEHAYLWNSSAASVITDQGGSLVSQDDAGTDGALNIYGAVSSRSAEYWSYATDFDGAVLATSRMPTVRFADGASITVDAGDTLTILGQSQTSNRTRLTGTGSGYGIAVSGTIDARYFMVDSMNPSGLVLNSGSTVTDLSYGVFDTSASASASYITVNGATSTKTFSGIVFDSAATGSDGNAIHSVVANGSGVNWTFTVPAGYKRSSSYVLASNGASVTMASPTLTVNDGESTDADMSTSSSGLAANWSMSSTDGVSQFRYAVGTSPGSADTVALTSTGSSMFMSRTGLSLINGATYYVTVQGFDSNDEPVVEGISDGVFIDSTAPTISNFGVIASETGATVAWTTDEASTTAIDYGTTASYGSSASDAARVTSHTVTLTGLTPSTVYHVRATSSDSAGNSALSQDLLFETAATPVAPTPLLPSAPTLNISYVSDGTNPSITVSVTAKGGQTIKLYIDGKAKITKKLTGSSSTNRTYSTTISLKKYKTGKHTIYAKAYTSEGKVSPSSKKIKFTIERSAGRTRVLLNSQTSYIVKTGDSLWKIARTFLGKGALYTKIIRSNITRYPSLLQNPGHILAGWVLKLVP